MIAFLSILFIVLFFGSFTAKYFADAVPFLAALSTPLIIVCVVEGLVLAAFVGIKIYNDVRGKK
ncbi:MAG: hypothetical protein NC311_12370 [Muribaculaceae bacterium]|nr:hypothetical protein [Muribaculaceae bacterium]